MRRSLTSILLLQAAAILAPAQAASITLPARWEYTAKFVCGTQTSPSGSPPSEPPVKVGNYATVINIHNPLAKTVILQKKVALAAPETYPVTTLIDPTRRFQDKLTSDHTMAVDCKEIVNLLTLNGTPPPAGSFIEGFLVVDAYLSTTGTNTAATQDVVAVTTTSDISSTGGPVHVTSHRVVTVPGRTLPAGTWPF